jgi:MFS transporter, Spinster family, sphingosine-1-phosphate transporter
MSVFYLAIINILSYLDRFLVQALQPSLIDHFHLSNREGGMLISAFIVGYLIFSPIFGYFGDRCKRPPLLALGVFLWSLSTILTAFASSFLLFLAARIFVGVGEAAFVAVAPGYIRDRLKDPTKVNSVLAFFSAAMPVGAALGFAFGSIVGQHYGWRAAFFFGGVPGILIALLVLRYPEVEGRALNTSTDHFEGIREIWRNRVLRYAVLGYVFNNFALIGVSSFITKYGMEIGFSMGEIGAKFGVILLVTGVVGALGGGAISSRLARGKPNPIQVFLRFVSISALIGVPFLGLALTESNHALFLCYCFIAQLFILAGVAPLNSVIVLASPSPLVAQIQGATVALINLFGSFLAPIAVGWSADLTTLSIGMQSCTIALLVSGLLWQKGSSRKVLDN